MTAALEMKAGQDQIKKSLEGKRVCIALACLVMLCALGLRLWFIQGGLVENPMSGDAIQYCNYAWNLANSQTFSMAAPGSSDVTPDGFRDPGYPLFLAVMLRLLGSGDTWYHITVIVQAILGSVSAGLVVLISARWLEVPFAVAAGLAVAIWPHNVAISDFLLSESLFGFLILLTLWWLVAAQVIGSVARWGLVGLALGLAGMVNATLVPFGLLLGAVLWLKGVVPRRLLVGLIIGSLILPLLWEIRGLEVARESSVPSRAITNLVQGSWPEYHVDYIKSLMGDPYARHMMQSIDDEVSLASRSPDQWLSLTAKRFAREPLHYFAWYSWKPALLWAWNIRMGFGDVYPHRISHPIYATHTPMRIFESICVAINPLLFVLMLAVVWEVLILRVRSNTPPILYAVALMVAYETLVYGVFQSEPRYSVPLRPLQMMLAATACWWMWRRLQAYRSARSSSGLTPRI